MTLHGGKTMASGWRSGGVQPAGIGRIVVWRGGSIWIGHAGAETDFHAHHAIQITIALSAGAVRFRRPAEEWTSYASVIIAAHQPHAFEASGELVAMIFAEPESRQGRVLRERYPAGIEPLAADAFGDDVAQLAAAFHQGAANDELAARARAIPERLTSMQTAPARPLDKRVERAVEVLRERLGQTVVMADVADAVHLSPDRFRHLFLEETGIRFRPYVLWLRLEVAVALYAAGVSLTDAAHAGGFADSAHFSRTFKRMFGVPAAGIEPILGSG
jgi:AraC family transcriptional regulator